MKDIRFNGKLDYMIDNIGFVNVLRNANFVFNYKNGKECNTIIFVENGEMSYYFTESKKSIKLVKNSILFIPKNTPYIATYTKVNTIAKTLVFDIVSSNHTSKFNTPVYKKEAVYSDIFQSISGQNTNNVTYLASKILELLSELEKEIITIPKKFKKVLPALKEIQTFYFENKKLSYYSNMCSMSESNFSKLFKEYTGKTFIEYRNAIRISEAHKMITSREYSVGEAAYLTGFNNMSFFYEVYNKYYK